MKLIMQKLLPALSVLVLLVLALFNTFTNIEQQQIAQWDEARHIASAIEMLKNQQWLVTTYLGETDYWNVKPPLSIWLTALSYHFFSPPLLALRLPSLIAVLLTTYIIFLYAKQWAGFYAGILASAFFLIAWPLFTSHAARTADPDMVFVLFTTLAWFLLAQNQRKTLFLAYIVLGFAFLAKSFHVAPYGLAAFLYCVYLYKQQQLVLLDLIRLPLCFLLPVLPWVIARYLADGGHFFEVMLFFDVVKRTTQAISGVHGESALHYFYVLFCSGIFFTIPIAGLSILFSRYWQVWRDKRFIIPLLWTILPLVTYMSATTKLDWYIYPVLPPLMVISAVIIVSAWAKLNNISSLFLGILLSLSFLLQEQMIVDYVIKVVPAEDKICLALEKLSKSAPNKYFKVFMESNPNFFHSKHYFYQHHYATALMLGNIELIKGGKEAFLQTDDSEVFLIDKDGHIVLKQAKLND